MRQRFLVGHRLQAMLPIAGSSCEILVVLEVMKDIVLSSCRSPGLCNRQAADSAPDRRRRNGARTQASESWYEIRASFRQSSWIFYTTLMRRCNCPMESGDNSTGTTMTPPTAKTAHLLHIKQASWILMDLQCTTDHWRHRITSRIVTKKRLFWTCLINYLFIYLFIILLYLLLYYYILLYLLLYLLYFFTIGI